MLGPRALHLAVWVAVVFQLMLPARESRGQTAEDLFQEAVVRYSMAKFKQSVPLLTRAKTMTNDPKLLGRIYLYLGLNHAVMGNAEEAEKAFHTALTHNPQISLDPKRFKIPIVSLFDRVRANMRGLLAVTADREPAVVLVDGKQEGNTPFSSHLPIGRHHVEVRTADGKYGYNEDVTLALEQETRVTAKLRLLYGRLTVHSTPPGAAVLVDGRPVGNTPLEKVQLEAGTHQLTVRLEGYKEQVAREKLVHNEERVVRVQLEAQALPAVGAQPKPASRQRGRRLWTWVAAGGAVATLAVAIGLNVSASSDYDEWQAVRDEGKDRQRWEDLGQSIERKDIAAAAMYATAGVLAATSVVLFFFEGRQAEEPSRTASRHPGGWSLGISHRGLTVNGRF